MVYCGANLNSRKKKEDAIFHANRYVTRYVGLIVGEHIIDVIYSKFQRRVCMCCKLGSIRNEILVILI